MDSMHDHFLSLAYYTSNFTTLYQKSKPLAASLWHVMQQTATAAAAVLQIVMLFHSSPWIEII
jgi:hypothetical protein